MDEGVDPTHMCQSLVEKVALSKQLRAVTEPDIQPLFEDWLDELEREVRDLVMATGSADPQRIARELGLSDNGVSFLLTKLRREEKIS